MRIIRLAVALVLLGLVLLMAAPSIAQSSSGILDFTGYYQGPGGGVLQPGAYSMRFAIYDSPSGGTRLWPLTADFEVHPLVLVSGGQFTVALGSQGYPVTELSSTATSYLEVAVCTPAGFECTGFEPLPTRLPISGSTPSSIETPLPSETTSPTEMPQPGQFSLAWLLAGNSGTNPSVDFLGTTDTVPFEIRVDNQPVLRIEPHPTSPNLIAGYRQNSAGLDVYGATISGGGSAAGAHSVSGRFGTISGGTSNTAGSFASVGGGSGNAATGWGCTISGGGSNRASADSATVAGGELNRATGAWSTIAGGVSNTASGDSSFIAGGQYNTASGGFSFAAGTHAGALHKGSFVWADSAGLDFQSTDDNQFLVRAFGGAIFNAGVSRFGMIVSSGTMNFTAPVPVPMPLYSSFAFVGLNTRDTDDAIGIWGHAGGAPNIRRNFGQVGVLGSAASGYGVVGATEGSTDGLAGGLFEALSNDGVTFAVRGKNYSNDDGSAGAFFSGEIGVLAETDYAGKAVVARVNKLEDGTATGYGVYAEGGTYGVYGEGGPVWFTTYTGRTSTLNPTYGVYGKASDPEAYGVYSEGDCHVDGKLTWKPAVGYVSVGPIAFAATAIAPFTYASFRSWSPVDAQPREDCGIDKYGHYDPTTRELYFAQLQLPHGAQLRKMDFHYSYTPGGCDSSLKLARSDFSGNVTFLAEIETKGGGLSSSIDHVVDNSTGFYYLFVALDCNTTLHGAVITYEVSEPN